MRQSNHTKYVNYNHLDIRAITVITNRGSNRRGIGIQSISGKTTVNTSIANDWEQQNSDSSGAGVTVSTINYPVANTIIFFHYFQVKTINKRVEQIKVGHNLLPNSLILKSLSVLYDDKCIRGQFGTPLTLLPAPYPCMSLLPVKVE